ncbi:MAG: hypothetical protein ABIK64_08960 [Bacillota bacterium]
MPAAYAIDQDWRGWAGAETVQAYMANQDFVVRPATEYADPTMDDDLNLIWTQVRKAIVDGTWNLVYAKNDGAFNYLLSQMIKNANGYGFETCAELGRSEAAMWRQMVQDIQNAE